MVLAIIKENYNLYYSPALEMSSGQKMQKYRKMNSTQKLVLDKNWRNLTLFLVDIIWARNYSNALLMLKMYVGAWILKWNFQSHSKARRYVESIVAPNAVKIAQMELYTFAEHVPSELGQVLPFSKRTWIGVQHVEEHKSTWWYGFVRSRWGLWSKTKN